MISFTIQHFFAINLSRGLLTKNTFTPVCVCRDTDKKNFLNSIIFPGQHMAVTGRKQVVNNNFSILYLESCFWKLVKHKYKIHFPFSTVLIPTHNREKNIELKDAKMRYRVHGKELDDELFFSLH